MAIAYRQQVDDDTEFAIWRIEEQADELYSKLQLNDDEKAYYEQLKAPCQSHSGTLSRNREEL